MFEKFEAAPALDVANIEKLFQDLKFNRVHRRKHVLYISDRNSVVQSFKSAKYHITEQVLQQMASQSLIAEDVFGNSRQLVSTCLSGMSIACSGLSSDEKIVLAKEIQLLGGRFVSKVDRGTSVLVTNRVISSKVFEARALEIPVLSQEWIHACFAKLERVPEQLGRVNKFEGLIVACSDLTPSQRVQVAAFVRKNGGVWSEVFDSSVDCVIAHSLLPTKKIAMALASNVPVIEPQWIIRQMEAESVSPLPFILNPWCCSSGTRLFDGKTFSVDESLPDAPLLRTCIEMNGGEVGKDAAFAVVPQGTTGSSRQCLVSPQWVWTCISERTICDVNESPLYRPLRFKCPVEEMTGKCVALLNMTDKCRLDVASLLRDIGIQVLFHMSKISNVIVAHKVSHELREYSAEYDIPVVSVAWVLDLITTGCFPDTQRHLLGESNTLTLEQFTVTHKNEVEDAWLMNPVSSPITPD